MNKQIAIIGLGLLGGSRAMALRGFEDSELVGVDRDPDTLAFAAAHGVADRLTDDAPAVLSQADVVYLCLHPRGIVRFLEANRDRFKPGALVTDVCGIKTAIVEGAAVLPEAVDFIGGHPMAGKERGGFTASAEDLYVGASMILTPDKRTDMRLLETLKAFFLDLGFAGLTFSTPEEHDRIIAFTSQLAHIVSSAYVKSPEAQKRRGFSAGSFQDMTRVARLDEDMWTELFLDDEDFLTAELEELIGHLTDYRNALRAKDTQRLHDLLKEGRELKATAGGN